MSVFIIALIEKFRDWLRYRGTLNALRQRTDRELEDFGFDRSNLRRIARESTQR